MARCHLSGDLFEHPRHVRQRDDTHSGGHKTCGYIQRRDEVTGHEDETAPGDQDNAEPGENSCHTQNLYQRPLFLNRGGKKSFSLRAKLLLPEPPARLN
jgi:hypothetical protein